MLPRGQDKQSHDIERLNLELARCKKVNAEQAERLRTKFERTALQIRVIRLENKLANAESQVVELANLIRQVKEENSFLSTRLKDVEEEAVFYSRALKDATSDEYNQSKVMFDRMIQEDLDTATKEKRDSDRRLLKHRARQSEAVCKSYGLLCQNVLSLSSVLNQCLQERDELVQQKVAELSVASDTRVSLVSRLEVMQTEREEDLKTISTLKVASERSERRLREMETGILTGASQQEETLKRERDAVQRLSSAVQKSRMAEEGLRSEIEELRTNLIDAERYQEAYYSLHDEVGTLIARNVLAEEEAERLSKFNAEILGHTNPAQRIMYVDRIRRELAETKQKLLAATREHEAAVADGNNLRHEVAMYKSVMIPIENKPRTNITRIMRPALATQSLNIGPPDIADKVAHVFVNDGEMTLDEIA